MPSNAKAYGVERFVGVLAQQKCVLIGGQAVNLWAILFQEKYPEIKKMAPFLSRDCDLLGEVQDLLALAHLTGADYRRTKAGSATPVVGFLLLKDPEGGEIWVDVVHTVRGLTPNETKNGVVQVQFEGRTIRTLSPILLLKAKIANACELPQAGRQDLHHIRILIPCVAAYLSAAARRYEQGELPERGLVRMLGYCWEVISVPRAKRLAGQHAIDFTRCFPDVLRKLRSLKVDRFYRHRLDRQ